MDRPMNLGEAAARRVRLEEVRNKTRRKWAGFDRRSLLAEMERLRRRREEDEHRLSALQTLLEQVDARARV